MEFPPQFRCPISMELMEEPTTISTGVTYERKNIEKWLFSYNKKTCPATMQTIRNFDLTPNHTLKRLIVTWNNSHRRSSEVSPPPEVLSALQAVEVTPFKESSLKRLRCLVDGDVGAKVGIVECGGVEVLVGIVVQVLAEGFDFSVFRACEEAIGVLNQLPLTDDDEIMKLLTKEETMKAFFLVLQRGSSEARLSAITLFQKISRSVNIDYNWNFLIQDHHGVDFFKSLLDLVSDEICTKASSRALEVLIQIMGFSNKNRVKAIQAGAICVLIELLPDSSSRSKTEKLLVLIKLLCECADGRLAFVEHGLGIAAVSKKIFNVSELATKIAVKILWLICSFHPSEKALEEMVVSGSVKKLFPLTYMSGRSSTKDRVRKIFKLHGNSWRRFPCFPSELKI